MLSNVQEMVSTNERNEILLVGVLLLLVVNVPSH